MTLGNDQPYLGRVIRSLRIGANLIQAELARRANIKCKYLGAIEQGSVEPTTRVLFRICAALGELASEVIKQVEQEIEKPETARLPPAELMTKVGKPRKARAGTAKRNHQSIPLAGWPLALRKAMTARGFRSQSALGTKSGVTPSTVGHALRGDVDPQISNLERMAWALQMSIGELAELRQQDRSVSAAIDSQHPEDLVLIDWAGALNSAIASRSDLGTQSALAMRSGLPQRTVGRILRGDVQDPYVSTVERLSSAFGMSLGRLSEMAPGKGLPATARRRNVTSAPPARKSRPVPRDGRSRR